MLHVGGVPTSLANGAPSFASPLHSTMTASPLDSTVQGGGGNLTQPVLPNSLQPGSSPGSHLQAAAVAPPGGALHGAALRGVTDRTLPPTLLAVPFPGAASLPASLLATANQMGFRPVLRPYSAGGLASGLPGFPYLVSPATGQPPLPSSSTMQATPTSLTPAVTVSSEINSAANGGSGW